MLNYRIVLLGAAVLLTLSEVTKAANTAEIESAPPLRTALAVHQFAKAQPQVKRAIGLQGVVTCVLPQLHALVLQDATAGIYVSDPSRTNQLPRVGDLVTIDGETVAGGNLLYAITNLGAGVLPEYQTPTWNQLMNGSMDCRLVEIRGVSEGVLHRSNGWSRLNLRTKQGILHVELRRAGLQPLSLDQCQQAVIRLRGCMFAAWDVASHKVKAGQIRMHDAEITLEEPAPEDLFSTPRKTAAALMRYDPDLAEFRRVRIMGQVVFVRGYDCFVMDGPDGLRLLGERPLGLAVGDLVEAVGFPEWGYASPCLRNVIVRKTGHAPLPLPLKLSPDELVKARHDAKLVQVEGVLASSRQTQSEQVLEMQSGSWRFLARLRGTNGPVTPLQLGSRLELTGVYCAQGGYKALGEDVAPIDLLIRSAADIKVLATPPWWTPQRVLIMAGMLGLLLVATLLWVTQLHRQVEQRTTELQRQIQNREQAEQQRLLELERTRIARDLHDELGADLTEIGMLATRAQVTHGSTDEQQRCLATMTQKTAQMVGALEEIVWTMNPQRDSLTAVINYFSFYADRFLGLAGIKSLLAPTSDVANVTVDARVRHQLFLVFKEALANVVKHSRATEVHLGISGNAGQLRVTVTDNGSGLPATSPGADQDGIANMRTRVEKLGGQIAITSESGRGTTVQFTAPLN